MSTTPPASAPPRDPDYDELWSLTGRLSLLVDLARDAGYVCDDTVTFTERDCEILQVVDAGDLDRGPTEG